MTKDDIIHSMLSNNKYNFSELGDVAYEAFYNAKHGLSYHSHPLHTYKKMDPHFQVAWDAFAYAIAIENLSAESAWNDYYIIATEGTTYEHTNNVWMYRKLDENTRLALISAKEAVYKMLHAINGSQTYH